MEIFTRLWFRLCALFRRKDKENDLADELQFHLEMTIQENIERGMDPTTARREALKKFGGIEQHKEDCRESWKIRIILDILRDVRLGARRLWKNKLFSITIILTLGLCIGANSAIFTIFNALVLRPLPFPEPDRLVEIYNSFPEIGIEKEASNIGFYNEYAQKAKSFENLSFLQTEDISLESERTPSRITASWVTSNFFETLRIQPFLGTFFDKEHSTSESNLFVILTHSYWKSNFNSEPDVLGKKMNISRRTYTICGISPPSLAAIIPKVDIIILHRLDPEMIAYSQKTLLRHEFYDRNAILLGRLKSGSSLSSTQSEINRIDREYYSQLPQTTKDHIDLVGHKSYISFLQNTRQYQSKQSLFLIQVSALSVLLVGLITICNLLRAYFSSRQSGFITNRRLGATSKDIIQQLLFEILLLIVAGGILGICLSIGGIYLTKELIFDLLHPTFFAQCTKDVSRFTLNLFLILGFCISLFLITQIHRTQTIKPRNRSHKNHSRFHRLTSNISSTISIQVSVTLILLTLAISLIHSLINALYVDLGFTRDNITTFSINLPNTPYRKAENGISFVKNALNSISQIPNIQSVSATSLIPHRNNYMESNRNRIVIKNFEPTKRKSIILVNWPYVSPGYFNTLNLSILEGRDFDKTDSYKKGSLPIIIDKTTAKHFFGETSPIGHYLQCNGHKEMLSLGSTLFEIIGVVQNAQLISSDSEEKRAHIYFPLLYGGSKYLGFLIKSKKSPHQLFPKIKNVIHELDPLLPIYGYETLDSLVDKGLTKRKIFTYPLVFFAILAALLSTIDIFGVLAYNISQRTKEIGMRSAIGATPWQILSLILREGITKILTGLVIGLIGAYFLAPLIKGFFFETSPRDPLIFFGAPLFLFLVAIIASYLPARRATKLNPVEALRYE